MLHQRRGAAQRAGAPRQLRARPGRKVRQHRPQKRRNRRRNERREHRTHDRLCLPLQIARQVADERACVPGQKRLQQPANVQLHARVRRRPLKAAQIDGRRHLIGTRFQALTYRLRARGHSGSQRQQHQHQPQPTLHAHPPFAPASPFTQAPRRQFPRTALPLSVSHGSSATAAANSVRSAVSETRVPSSTRLPRSLDIAAQRNR